MIVLDFNGIVMAALFSNNGEAIKTCDEGLIRHIILNSIRANNVKYRNTYGEMYLACDWGSWRKNYFKEYKASRKTSRESSDVDWTKVFEILNKIREELVEYSPYHVLHIEGCEADDIIAQLVMSTQEFGCSEKVMIVSNDMDFIQLHRYHNVKQFAPNKGKMITDSNPDNYLMEHILRGDTGDGVPNVLSDDDTFVTDKRQTPLRKNVMDEWKDHFYELDKYMSDKHYRNFQRNRTVIDLSYIPDDIKNKIDEAIAMLPKKTNMKMLNYLIKNRCHMLIDCVNDFFVSK
jgi:hypothetical protein